MIHLLPASPEFFDSLLEKHTAVAGCIVPDGGLEIEPILQLLKQTAANLQIHSPESGGSYAIAAGNKLVGLCGYKSPPDRDTAVEIGYSIHRDFRRRGFATAAVAKLLSVAREDKAIKVVKAECEPANEASCRVLKRNNFSQTGCRIDAEDGLLLTWSISV